MAYTWDNNGNLVDDGVNYVKHGLKSHQITGLKSLVTIKDGACAGSKRTVVQKWRLSFSKNNERSEFGIGWVDLIWLWISSTTLRHPCVPRACAVRTSDWI